MKRSVLTLVILLGLLALGAGCAATPTVTVGPSATATATVTTTAVAPGALFAIVPQPAQPLDGLVPAATVVPFAIPAVPLDTNGPVIPHAGTVGGQYGTCYNCHGVLPDHVGENANLDNCMNCHAQGNIVLVP